MTQPKSPIEEVLRRHGIEDPRAYLNSLGEDIDVDFSKDPSVFVTGSIELMREKEKKEN